MNNLFRPFPVLLATNFIIIGILFFAATETNFQVKLTGSSSPGSGRTPLMGSVQHINSNINGTRTSNYLTYSNGNTDRFIVEDNDIVRITSEGYRPLVLKINSLDRYTKLGVNLYRNTTIQPFINGMISFNGMTGQEINVYCVECPEPTNRTRTVDGIYSIPTGSAESEYTLQYNLSNSELLILNIKPETKDDHATIDIAFDDSHGMFRKFASFFSSMPRLLTSE